MVWRVSKISPTNVGLPLQSRATLLLASPVFGSTAIALVVKSRNDEKSPPIMAGVGMIAGVGVACRMRSPS